MLNQQLLAQVAGDPRNSRSPDLHTLDELVQKQIGGQTAELPDSCYQDPRVPSLQRDPGVQTSEEILHPNIRLLVCDLVHLRHFLNKW